MNISNIKERIKVLTKKREEINELSQFVNDINRNLRYLKARQQLDQFKIEYPLPNPYRSQYEELRDEIEKLEKQLKDIRAAKVKPIESYFIKSKRISIGTTDDRISRIIGVQFLDDKKCNVLVYVPGHTGYVNRMTGSVYSPSRIFVVKNAEVDDKRDLIFGNLWSGCVKDIREEGFKLTNKGLMESEEQIKNIIPNFVSIVPPKGYAVDYNAFEKKGKKK